MKKITTALLATTMLLASCGSEQPAEKVETTVQTKEILKSSIILPEKPAGAVTVSEARKLVEPGKEVTVFGTVGGSVSPFVATRASMIIADHTVLRACRTQACTSCPTPWDYCCEPKEVLGKAILTVQFVDSEGMVLKQGLEGFGDMKKNGIVTVKGKFAENATDQLVIINAENIFVDK